MKNTINVNWDEYLNVFPDRYINPSKLDDMISLKICKMLKKKTEIHALDIGGGIYGSKYLDNQNIKCWALDTYITKFPTWIVDTTDWSRVKHMKFDLIVLRGSFNYLTKEQIELLPKLLNVGGTVMFNSFYSAPTESTRKRTYTNTKSKISGLETICYNGANGVITHKLEPDNTDYIIEHEFFVYDIISIINMLGIDGLKIQFTGVNSTVVCKTLEK